MGEEGSARKLVDEAFDEAAMRAAALLAVELAGEQLFDTSLPEAGRLAALERIVRNVWKAAMLTNRIDEGQNQHLTALDKRVTALEVAVASLNGGTVQAA